MKNKYLRWKGSLLVYIIHRVDTNEYLVLKGSEFKGWDADIEKAYKFATMEKASNVLSVTFKNKFATIMDKLHIVEYGVTVPEISEEQAQKMSENVESVIAQVVDIKSDIPALIAYYNKQLSHYDLITQDILHKIELDSVTGIMAVRLVRQLKQARIKRREAKDKLMLLSSVLTGITIAADNANKHATMIENRHYNPRVLTELFEK